MPKADKDIAGKIIDFLREKGGRAVFNQTKKAADFNCAQTVLGYSSRRLIEAGIVLTSRPIKRGSHKPVEFILSDEFKEGDSWREALKRKSSGDKAETGPGVPAEVCHSEECLGARKVLLEELLKTLERLKVLQEENKVLRSTEARLQKRIDNLEGEAKSRGNARRQLASEVTSLESRVGKLRTQTMSFDDSGVVILRGEERPDRS